MAAEQRDWAALAEQYSIDYEAEQVSPAEWCSRVGVPYSSAKRYITVKAAKAECELRNSQAKKKAPKPGRDEKGYFLKGHKIPECYKKNLDNLTHFEEGNQAARTHGGYAKYLRIDDLEVGDESEIVGLIAERRMFRARIASAMRTIFETEQQLSEPETTQDPELVAVLQRLIRQAEKSIEISATRVESLTRTLSGLQLDKSKLRLDDVMEPKIVADTEKSRSQKRKLDAEAIKLERDHGGDTTPLDEIVEDLQSIGSGGLMS